MSPASDLADLIIKWDLLVKAEEEGHPSATPTDPWGQIPIDRRMWNEWVRLSWAVVKGGGL